MKQIWIWFTLVILLGLVGLAMVQEEHALADGVMAPSLWVTPATLDFTPVPVGQTGFWFFTFFNMGDAPLTITEDATYAPPFSGTLPACATNLAPGSVCQIVVQFSPATIGVFSQTLQFQTNAGPFSVHVQGEGVAPPFYFNPLALDFGSVLVGNSRSDAVTIYNTGAYHLDFSTSSPPSPHFGSSSGDCSGGLNPGDSCIVYLSFTPGSSGTFTDTYTIHTAVGDHFVQLQGRGRSVPFIFGPSQRVTPRALDFGPVPLSSGKTLTVTITNQSLDTAITGWAGGGVGAPFSAGQNCASGLPAGDSCHFSYGFNPTAEGVFTEDSNVSNSAGSFTIDLRGEGVWAEPFVREKVVHFGPRSTATDVTVSLSNIGHTQLYLNDVTVSDPALFNVSWGCSSGLPPHQPNTFCGLDYDFHTLTPGLITATSTVETNGGSLMITLVAGAHPALISLAFVPDQIIAEGTSQLQYRINNPNPAATFYFVAFTAPLPPGVAYAEPLFFSASPACGAPTLTPIAGNPPTFTMSDGTILGGTECVVSLDVTAAADGVYTHTLDFVETGTDPLGPTWLDVSNPATAVLRVGLFELFLPVVVRP